MTVATKVEWLEQLPSDCPPNSAYPPEDFVCFRLMSFDPPHIEDFYSQRRMNPQKTYKTPECRARSLSILSDLNSLEDMMKFPTLRNKIPFKITLSPESGPIMQTGKPSHYSWWVKADYQKHILLEAV